MKRAPSSGLRRRVLAASSLMVLALGGMSCRGCGREGPASALGLVDPGAAAVLHVPDLGRLSRGVGGFVSRATRGVGGMVADTLRTRVRAQLGFDPLDAAGWAQAGIDASGGMVLFTEGVSTRLMMGVGVSDAARFDAALAQMIEKADGANQVTTSPSGRYRTIGRPFGDQVVPVLHWAHVGRFAVLAGGDEGATLDALLQRLAAPAAPSLAEDATYRKLVEQVPPGELMLLLRGEASKLVSAEAGEPVVADSLTSVRIAPQGLSADTFIGLDLPALSGELSKDPTLPLAGRIEDDAVMVVLTRAARKEGIDALRTIKPVAAALDRSVAPIRSTTGVDAERDALPAFAGPMTVGVHLWDVENLSRRVHTRDLSRVLDVFHVAVTADLRDAAAMRAVLERSRDALSQAGSPIRSRTLTLGEREALIFEPDVPEPRLGWAILGDTYVYGAGTGRLERTLRHLTGAPSKLPASLDATVAGNLAEQPNAGVVVVRAAELADAITRAKLSGAAASVLAAAVEVVRSLGDIALSLRAEEGGLRLELREQLR